MVAARWLVSYHSYVAQCRSAIPRRVLANARWDNVQTSLPVLTPNPTPACCYAVVRGHLRLAASRYCSHLRCEAYSVRYSRCTAFYQRHDLQKSALHLNANRDVLDLVAEDVKLAVVAVARSAGY